MKNITLLALAVLSMNTALASEKDFQCEARFIRSKEVHVLTGTITSNTSMRDVVYTSNTGRGFAAGMLMIDKKYQPRKYSFYQQMVKATGEWIEAESMEEETLNFAVLMPEKMSELNRFEAMVRQKNDRGGETIKFDCVVEN